MVLIFSGLLCVTLLSIPFSGVFGSQSLHNVPWLPCQLVDEQVEKNEEGHTETRYHHRNAVLQFGHRGDSPVHSNAITFLVIGSKVDMRRYVDGGEDQLQCEIRRYSTGGIQVRWPGPGAQEQDTWFTCTLRHSDGLFVVTTFLRHSPATPSTAQLDYEAWAPIGDRDTLSTAAAMVVLTRTPSVEVGLLKEQSLHCQFAVDHKLADLTVEWRLQRRGERSKLFSYSGRSGKSEGGGASARAITGGDASLKLPLTRHSSEGTYVCSVYVPPLYGSHDIALHIMESPRVSLSVGAALSLVEGAEQKVVCEAGGYYPLDVEIEWLREPGEGSRLPEVLKNILFSSHRHHQDGTYSLSAFFLLMPSLQDSGYRYTCRVSHHALRMPIRKSFTLTVTEETSVLWGFAIGFIFLMVGILAAMLHHLYSVRGGDKKKPY